MRFRGKDFAQATSTPASQTSYGQGGTILWIIIFLPITFAFLLLYKKEGKKEQEQNFLEGLPDRTTNLDI